MVLGLMKGQAGLLSRWTDDAEMELGAAGAASITYISAATATDITDGTTCVNGFASVTTAGTFVDKEVTLSLKPSQARSTFTKPGNLAKFVMRAADAFYQQQANAGIAALKAATVTSGCNAALPTGQVDFVTDGTAGEAASNLRTLGIVIANTLANFSNYAPEQFSIVVPPVCAAYILALAQSGVADTKYFAKTTAPGAYMGMSFWGIPFYTVTGATSFGGASNEALFITTKDSVLLARQLPSLHGGGVMAASDGTFKWITVGPFAYAALPLFGEVTNPAS